MAGLRCQGIFHGPRGFAGFAAQDRFWGGYSLRRSGKQEFPTSLLNAQGSLLLLAALFFFPPLVSG